jgi:hypothetical protein
VPFLAPEQSGDAAAAGASEVLLDAFAALSPTLLPSVLFVRLEANS